jgi:hypothetical protein
MRTLILIVGLFLSTDLIAQDQWLCTSQSSVKYTDSIDACGVASAPTEGQARLKAFDAARAEFNKVCKSSDDCDGYKINAVPKRTTCEESNGVVKCYRLISFNILDEEGNSDKSASQSFQKTETFTPFNVESIKNVPKVRKGLTKKQVLAQFGKPSSADNTYFNYTGNMCNPLGAYTLCLVQFDKGKVSNWTNFKAEYTTDLD